MIDHEPLAQIAWTYGPVSTAAVVGGFYYAWKTKKTSDEQMALARAQYLPSPQASLVHSTPGHIELSNAHGGHNAYVHGLRGLHRTGENSDTDVEYHPWGPVGMSLPVALPPGSSLICEPLEAVLPTHPIHRLEAELSWSAKPHRGCMITVPVPVLAPTC